MDECLRIQHIILFALECLVFLFKQKTAYEMRISDWSSDVCSSDLRRPIPRAPRPQSVRPVEPRNRSAHPSAADTPAKRGCATAVAATRTASADRAETCRGCAWPRKPT